MRAIAAIILSVFTPLVMLNGQDENPPSSGGASFPIHIPASLRVSTAFSDPPEAGLIWADSTLQFRELMIENPLPVRTTVVMDSTATYFTMTQTINGSTTGIPRVVAIDQYVQQKSNETAREQFKSVTSSKLQAEKLGGDQSLEIIGADIAGQRVSLRVRGNVNITGKLRSEDRTQTTNVSLQNQSNTFQIEQKQAFKIEGKIGDRISIQVDQDSERDFDFENNMEIYYNGNEDEIIQKVEAGNISLNLPGTKLAMFSGQNNGLFGLKALAKVGPVDITTIASLERGRKEKLSLSGSSAESKVSIDDYSRQKNTYFYINKFYYRKSYPLSDNGRHILSGRSIQNIRVYKYTNYSLDNETKYYAKIYNYPNTDSATVTSRPVVQLEQGADGDFIVYEDLGVIRMNRALQDGEVLAIAYRDTFIAENVNDQTTNLYVREYNPEHEVIAYPSYQEGNDVALGTPGLADTLELKMIKPDDAQPGDETWDLEWKNVYNLKSQSINKEGFDLKIIKSTGGEESELADDGTPFLQLFGLDRKGIGAEQEPDGIIDLDYEAILNLRAGELVFPYLNPFMPDSTVDDHPAWMTNATGSVLGNGGNPNLNAYPQYQSSSFYLLPEGTSNYRKDSKFRVDVTYSNPSSTFNLGFNVIEGSEEVTLNGVPLEKGASRDYTIDYFTGQLVILNPAALAPGANLDIKYELNEFFQLDKKVILGSRAEIKFGENKESFVGLSTIYFSKSSIDEKVRVGKEPMQNFVWDLNTRISQDLPWLTRGLDWLPLVQTDANSKLTVDGEIAQVIPNPNTSNNKDLDDVGVAYIDDFEGSRRESKLSILRGSWGLASIPVNNSGRGNRERAFTYWYNPYNRVFTKSIWPNKETSAQAQNDVTDILSLHVIPDSAFSVIDGGAPGEAWGGIMRALSSGYYDQSESKFLELWVKGDEGRLHLDLGYISEDLHEPGQSWTQSYVHEDDTIKVRKGYGGQPDTEDIPTLAFPQGDGFVIEDEDLGIDGLPANTPIDIGKYGYHHPAWDQYAFNPNETPIDYSQINGEEGNLQIEGGTYPDTEDLNNDGALSTRNAYFSIDVDLATDDYVAGRTEFSEGVETGWKLISIPLADFVEAGTGTPSWSQIKYARLWMDEVPKGGTQLQIATVDIVGNEWQERGIFSRYDGIETALEDSLHGTMNVSVINTEDNPTRYDADATEGSYGAPPAGVRGILDPLTQLRSKEQSLLIRIDNLEPGFSAITDKQFHGSKPKDFIHYKTMKMFIHGWDKTQGDVIYESGFTNYMTGGESKLEFIFRFGETDDNYYEVRKPVYPGWDKRNHLDITLSDLANFKLALEDSLFANVPMSRDSTVFDTSLFWMDLPKDYQYATKLLSDGSTIGVKGSPSMSRVKIMKAGIRNLTTMAMSGEIWLDELRLSDVEKNTATAYRANMNVQFADLASVNMDIQKNEADFHNVQEQFGSGDNSTAINVSGNLSAHKLLPSSWGLSIPLSLSYRNSERQPKYMTGSDIRIADLDLALRDTVETMTTRSEATSFNFSLSKTTKSDHWLPKFTLDRMNFKLGGTQSVASNAQQKEQKAQKINGNFAYSIDLGDKFKVTPLKFIESLPLIGESLAGTELSYLPTRIGVNGNLVESKSSNIYRNPNATPLKPRHELSMTRNVDVSWNLLSSVTAKYTANMSNNLDSLIDHKEDIIKKLDFGHLGNYRESYNLNWRPRSLRLLSPNVSYSSNFTSSDKIDAAQPGMNLNVNASTTAGVKITMTELFKLAYTPETKANASAANQSVQRSRGRRRQVPQQEEQQKDDKKQEEEQTEQEDESSPITKLLDLTYAVLEKVDPIDMQVRQDRQTARIRRIASIDTVVYGRPGLPDTSVLRVREIELSDIDFGYRMGFNLSEDYLSHPDEINPISRGDNVTLTLRSGVKLSRDLSSRVSFSLSDKSLLQTRSQGEVITSNLDYAASGALFGEPAAETSSFGTAGFPFPTFNLRYTGLLDDFESLKKFLNSASVDLNYAGKRNSTVEKGRLSRESYSVAFSPLVGLTLQGKKNINGSMNYSLSRNINNSINSSTGETSSNQTYSQSLNASVSYAHKGGLTIPLPVLKNKRLDNNIDFRLEISYTKEQDYSITEQAGKVNVEGGKFSKSLSFRPGIQYSFTDKVSGNVSYEYRISETTLLGRQDVGDFQFGVNIQIKG